ncbi:MAG: penicillin-binding protein [Owenweeksia sp.]|nr:penicillin-binding protein [Owenweeksia sp.]MBF99157.1 penicillin-binding protein [Owenweeksia sp.]HBF19892.1 penicillin-binding protein [Cryomorphaceae bacterium]HCQ14966.1 penicillin-binding protein [Cryomorphaceae bacterium]|tara:strand:- start:21980 stop:24280 length:2301 start_codon:yes stop_codon:yes gene_type:complete
MAVKKKKKDNDFSSYVKWFWILILSGIGAVVLCILLAAVGAFGPLPSFKEIENPRSNLASQIITSDHQLLGKFYLDNRTHADYEELSPHLINALVSTEDERYYEHSGIDFEALARAVVRLGGAGGGSTITQQLAKQLFHNPANSFLERIPQKFKEWVIAVQLERQYTKQEIIAMYFNQFDFLYQAVGINSAASIYFNTTPDSLSLEQSAVLVGMAKNPSWFNPVRDTERMKERRNVVYRQMVRNDMLTQAEYDTLKERPIQLDFKREGHLEGLAPYFREYLRSYMKEWIDEHPKPDGSKYNLYTDGLKIYTTIDYRMQKYAEEAVTEHMSNLQQIFFKKEKDRKYAPFHNVTEDEIDRIMERAMRRSERYKSMKRAGVPQDSIELAFNTPIQMSIFTWDGDKDTVMSPLDSIRYYKYFYQCGMMSVEPKTGFVKAWVGGINYEHFKYDHVKLGKRQVGSTFKPFVYATAIKQKHYSPCFKVPNVLTCIEAGKFGLLKDWCPQNSDHEYGGEYTLKYALANSVNTVTTYLMKQVGPEPVVRLIKEMGIEDDFDVQPAIALGTVDISVYDMVGSYTTFANKGVYNEPIMITRIEDRNGVVLQEFIPRSNEVMSEEDAYVVLDLLKGVTQGGTGTRLRTGSNYSHLNYAVTGAPYQFKNPIAGKTGTTQNNSDGWFMGVVPNLITGVWAGCEDRAAHFGGTAYGQGATVALPVWALYMKKLYADEKLGISKDDFERPESPLSIDLYCADNDDPEEEELPKPSDNPEFDY